MNEGTGIFICLAVYLLLGVTLIPSEPVTLMVLTWKGPYIALLLAVIGNTLAAIVEMLIAGKIGDLSDFEKRRKIYHFTWANYQ